MDVDPEIVERMVKLVRGMTCCGGNLLSTQEVWEDAREIAKLLPDPDLEKARGLFAQAYGREPSALTAGDPDSYAVKAALAGIKWGREHGR